MRSDATLIARLQHGDRDAATALYLRYAQRIEKVARKNSAADLVARFDAEDVVQSVFRTFFRRASRGDYQLPSGDELWKLLLVIALNKVRRLSLHHRAQMRDVGKTSDLSEDNIRHAKSIEPAEGLAILQDVVSQLLSELPESHRTMIRMRIDGASLEEVSTAVQRSRRTVERVLHQFRERLSSLLEPIEEDEAPHHEL